MRLNERGVIVPLVLLGMTAILSGIGLFLYLRNYPRRTTNTPTTYAEPSLRPSATIKPAASVNPSIVDFKSCAENGNPVMESYPRTCRNGVELYTEVIEASSSSRMEASASAQPGLTECDDFGCNNQEELR